MKEKPLHLGRADISVEEWRQADVDGREMSVFVKEPIKNIRGDVIAWRVNVNGRNRVLTEDKIYGGKNVPKLNK